MIPHIYRDIPGYFSWKEWYSNVVTRMADERRRLGDSPVRIVELGTCGGCSLSYLMVELINVGLRGHVYGVDVDNSQGTARAALKEFLTPSKYRVGLDLLTSKSWDAAVRFDAGSLDLVFIDADHEYESVRKDIAAWLPKVARGGIIAGHDYCDEFPGVIEAVAEVFPLSRVEITKGDLFGDPPQYFPVWSVNV